MVEGIIIGVAATVIATAILAATGRLTRLFQIPLHVRAWEITVNRAKKDYGRWQDHADRELAEQLRQIDEDHNARGIYHSGIRLQARAKAEREMKERAKDEKTKMGRKIDDALHDLRAIDRAWLAVKYRGDYGRLKAFWTGLTKQPKSLEDDVIDPVFRRMKGDN